MRKIRHSKFKNTGFLFEILTRQITLEVLNGGEEKAKDIVKEFFSGKTESLQNLKANCQKMESKKKNIFKNISCYWSCCR